MGQAKQRGTFKERAATATKGLNLVELSSDSEEFKSAKKIGIQIGLRESPSQFAEAIAQCNAQSVMVAL